MYIEVMLQYPNDCKPIKVLGIEVTQVYNIKWSFAGDPKNKTLFLKNNTQFLFTVMFE